MQAVRKLHGHLRAVKEAAVERTLPAVKEVVMAPHARTMDEELDEAALVRSILYDGITELSCKCELHYW